MNFHLEFTPKPFVTKINHRHKLLLMGSCFTENIGDKLIQHKFSVLQNPNGILFNPVSVADALQNYMQNHTIAGSDLFYLNEAYHSWQHHSRFSSPQQNDAVIAINKKTEEAHQFLKQADFILITFGSAWVYELTEKADNKNNNIVAANNHKAPADWFRRRLLSSPEVENLLDTLINDLKKFNPALHIIFTISPVRHLREGFIENNRSKAVLINAVHTVVEKYDTVSYFPAYELVIDDLRDYRFYAEDMVHPNYTATNYVWEKFVSSAIDEPSQELMKTINEINAAKSHKAFNPQSEAHKKFLKINSEKIDNLQQQYSYINFDEERKFFKE
ncbi:MAG: GSCFA domain-containing protein [Bacteroidetes bacterium]|nr:GSCFA domain-containing protein [Bacteroidota bacterium]MBS1755736.1 GSCFA domain-containing protein [Bacteroidota bacterium]